MNHAHSHVHHAPQGAFPLNTGPALNKLAWVATAHCLMGCAIGEIAGMLIGTSLGWSNLATIALAVGLAFLSGFALTALPLLRGGFKLGQALRLALAADSASIAIMEVVDNGIMLIIPGAMDAGLDSLHFWASMILALLLAGVAAWPVNRWLIARGRGHAAVHRHHQEAA